MTWVPLHATALVTKSLRGEDAARISRVGPSDESVQSSG